MTTFSPAPKPRPTVKPPKGMKKINKVRAAESFARCYGSRARQKWVNLRPCAACGVWGYSENAHVLGVDGAGLKGPYKSIAPLCGVRADEDGKVYEGCHRLSHRDPAAFRAKFPLFDAKQAARYTQKEWLRFLAGSLSSLPDEGM